MKKKKLSLEPYKGTRDFYPADFAVQNYIMTVMRTVVESFGFTEYGASILEETSLYTAKSSEEIVNEQTYSFTDRGGRNVTMRPEMTPTVARMVAKKRKELSFPLRWYSIPNLFRYERPQRGRLREHWQLNVDIFGEESASADIEILYIAYAIMKTFGAQDDNFEIKVNSRALLNYVLREIFTLGDEEIKELSRLIDRKDKIKKEDFVKQLKSLMGAQHESVIRLLDIRDVAELIEELPRLKGTDAIAELERVTSELKVLGVTNAAFDFSLVRGFDYYTGVIFEVFDTGPKNNRSLFGGGRYDKLVGMFDVEDVPAIGFGMGDVPIRDYIETYDLMPDIEFSPDVYLCNVDIDSPAHMQKIAQELRSRGLAVAVDLGKKKIGNQIKYADKNSIPFVVCIGENEIKTKEFAVKDIRSGESVTLSLAKAAKYILNNT